MRNMTKIRLYIRTLLLLTLCTQAPSLFSQQNDTIYYQRIYKLITPESIPPHEGLYDSVQARLQQHYSGSRQALTDFYTFSPYWTEQLQKAGLPDIFKYIPLLISQMKPHYYGNFQKAGWWGIDRTTGIRHHLRMDSLVDERFDPVKASDVAVKELQRMMQLYEGNVWECLLAYYSSPANVNGCKIRLGLDNPSPWDLQSDPHRFPSDVLTSFLAWIYICHHGSLSQQQMHSSPLLISNAVCRKPVQTADLTNLLQIGQDWFEKYNPSLIGTTVPAATTIHLPPDKRADFERDEAHLYQLYLERQTADSIAKAKADSIAQSKPKTNTSQEPAKSGTVTYIVKKGDVLGKIAQKHHVSVADIKRWNHLKSDMIQIGQKLIIHQ